MDKTKLIDLVDNDSLYEVFEELYSLDFKQNRTELMILSKTFIQGKTDIDFHNRLKTYILSLKNVENTNNEIVQQPISQSNIEVFDYQNVEIDFLQLYKRHYTFISFFQGIEKEFDEVLKIDSLKIKSKVFNEFASIIDRLVILKDMIFFMEEIFIRKKEHSIYEIEIKLCRDFINYCKLEMNLLELDNAIIKAYRLITQDFRERYEIKPLKQEVEVIKYTTTEIHVNIWLVIGFTTLVILILYFLVNLIA